ncbi:transcription factor EC-like isoform X2 [Amphiura filiformis]|uniref:transcription factor EC-like isoform X2 n=1 Tax=Amphiura filiformis TaxID=82378 RepID=UPI003B227977
MQDSGVDLELDLQLNITDIDNLEDPFNTDSFDLFSGSYTLKSQPIDKESVPPEPAFSSNAMAMRTNFKQELQRQQLQQQDKIERDEQIQRLSMSLPTSMSQAMSSPMDMASSSTLTTIPEVPRTVLKVETKLENPTRYFLQQTQKRQVQQYLSASKGSPHLLLSPQQAPASPNRRPNGSQSSVPNSPMSTQEVDDILDEVISLESSIGEDTLTQYLQLTDAPIQSAMPVSHSYMDPVGSPGQMQQVAIPNTSISCPADLNVNTEGLHDGLHLSDDQARAFAKERQKKDNHNMIERRRRFNINDRIKELGTLIPKTIDPDSRQNKGTILKTSVDYIKRLQKDQTKYKQIESRQKQLERANRLMMLRIQELEMRCKDNNIPTTALSSDTKTENIATEFMRLQGTGLDLKIKEEPPESPRHQVPNYTDLTNVSNTDNVFQPEIMPHSSNPSLATNILEDMVDDSPPPIVTDLLLSQSSPMASLQSSRRSSLSMDDMHDMHDMPPSDFLST